jgi:hypothetical protein
MILEVSQFRLGPGVGEQAFLEAAEESQSGFLGAQAGFVSRDLLRAEDGSWMDIVRFEEMLDTSSVSMSHWSVARTW